MGNRKALVTPCEQQLILCHSVQLLERFALLWKHAHACGSGTAPCLRPIARALPPASTSGPPLPCGLRSVQRGRQVTR